MTALLFAFFALAWIASGIVTYRLRVKLLRNEVRRIKLDTALISTGAASVNEVRAFRAFESSVREADSELANIGRP